MKTTKFVRYGLLVTLAMTLSYLEAQIPPFFAIPGIKPGLTNVVVLYALYAMDNKSAVIINIIRIFLVGLLFGNGVSIAFSVAGGLLSWLAMVLLNRFSSLKMVTVSVAGGIAHNIGQILVAMFVLNTRAIAWYLIILWFSGIASGIVVGIVGAEVVKRVKLNKHS